MVDDRDDAVQTLGLLVGKHRGTRPHTHSWTAQRRALSLSASTKLMNLRLPVKTTKVSSIK